MQIHILDSNFNSIFVTDNFIELKYNVCFREAGELYMRLPYSRELYKALLPSARLLVDKQIYSVEKLSIAENEIRVSALGLFAELRQYVLTSPITFSTTPYAIISSLVSELELGGIQCYVYGISSSTPVIELYAWCMSYEDIIKQLMREHDLGYHMEFDANERILRFFLLKLTQWGGNRQVISDKRDHFELLESMYDITSYKNYAELVQSFYSQGTIRSFSKDISGGEAKRRVCSSANIVFNTEGELIQGANTRLNQLIDSHKRKHWYKIRPLVPMSIGFGELYTLECARADVTAIAYLARRTVEINDTGTHETLVLEVKE